MTTRIDQWDGFSQHLFGDREVLEKEITRRRMKHGTFKHERQVKAEAEVAMIISATRGQVVRLPGHNSTNGFFLSHSRVIDNIDGMPNRLTITPESLFQWLLSVRPISAEEAKALFDQLLYDLAETGHQILPREKILQSFSRVIQASKDSIKRVVAEHREIVYEIYGEEPTKAFNDIDELEVPDAAEQIKLDVLRETERRRQEEATKRHEAEKVAKTATIELAALQRFKAKKEQKRKKAQKNKRAAQSRKRKK